MSSGAPASVAAALAANFLGHSPAWYKRTIVAFLVLNPALFAVSPHARGLGAGVRVHLHARDGAALLSAAARRAARARSFVHRHDDAGRRVRRGDQGHRRGAAARVHGRGHLLPEAVAAVRVHERAAEGAREGAARAAVLRHSGGAVRVPRRAHRDGRRDRGRRRILRRVSPGGLGQALQPRRPRSVERRRGARAAAARTCSSSACFCAAS